MSPQQAAGRLADYRSDQFAFGSILHEMLTGRLAFREETVPQTLAAIIKDEPELLRSSTSTLPTFPRLYETLPGGPIGIHALS